MAFSSPSGSDRPGFFRPQAEINVTPLVDVMLVLLIIFMVTAPLLTAGLKVQLPQAQAARPLDPKEPVVVVVGRDGGLAVGNEPVEPADLVQLVKLKLGDDLNRVVHLRGDKEVAYGRMVEVLDQLASNGITHIAIVTDARKKAAASAPSAPPPATEQGK
ncbi:biopolymer transporter ExbD [Rhodoblastus acidophilus]|uniref:Biopolymer transporter ExbD n=1 Tax=Candidatus Rhodoblastus alkanivorans TaxID=2954117 RepID=A0ABS9ZB01_9HYPH|nr:biopolymer transporter ExbD [Candidatus Rhodoblastus alkanivorans]MCI4679404.1 biopolymer transporter ExbD [Candidatus Rhodoblastus alkanivorans]MCI4684880.1 biopolymer transporter ExbD [Candidatus Rhodoblastus alkanivorans]MDI4642204.1 biopolymer transporter ExbD [Rhodoblastus acidophilus]